MINQKNFSIGLLSKLALICVGIETDALISQSFANVLNQKELSITNKLATNRSLDRQFNEYNSYLDSLKKNELTEDELQNIQTQLSALKEYVLYPYVLSKTITKYPQYFAFDEFKNYFLENLNGLSLTNRMLYSLIKGKDNYNEILDILSGFDLKNSLNLRCINSISKVNSGNNLNKEEINSLISEYFQNNVKDSDCFKLNEFTNKYSLTSSTINSLKQYLSKESNINNNLTRLSGFFSTNPNLFKIYNYAISSFEDKSQLLNTFEYSNEYSAINEVRAKRIASSYKYTDYDSMNNFITEITSSNLDVNIQRNIIANYLNRYYNRIGINNIDKFILNFYNDTLLIKRIRDAILNQDDYSKYLELLTDSEKNKSEWIYWSAKSLREKNPRLADQLLTSLARNETGFYPMLASELIKYNYQNTINRFNQELQAPYNMSTKLPWFDQAILESVENGNTTIAFDLYNELEIDKNSTSLINWAYTNNMYFLGVNNSIKRAKPKDIQARFPDAYKDIFNNYVNNRTVTKTFAQAIGRQESAWNFNIKSPANAYGLMQFINATAKRTADKLNLPYSGVSSLTNPDYAINLGTYHLSELLNANNNNRALAAIGYNAGPGRIISWLNRSNGRLNFDEFVATIPFSETRNYVMNTLTFDFYHQVLQKKVNPITFYSQEINRKY